MKVDKFTITRSLWARGGHPNTSLLDIEGKMCCLGFYALACGYQKTDILNLGEPHEINAHNKDIPLFYPSWLVIAEEVPNECEHWEAESYHMEYGVNDDGGELMKYNDSDRLSESEREAKVAEVFARHGVTVEFAD